MLVNVIRRRYFYAVSSPIAGINLKLSDFNSNLTYTASKSNFFLKTVVTLEPAILNAAHSIYTLIISGFFN